MKYSSIFVFGTSAEIIKIQKLVKLMQEISYTKLFNLNQQKNDTELMLQKFDLTLINNNIGVHLRKNTNLWYLLKWLVVSIFSLNMRLKKIQNEDHGREAIIFVQGDTLSALIGAILARYRGIKLFHIEAGLRSNSLTSPFPEEIIRKVITLLAHFHFAPSADSFQFLVNKGKSAYYTKGNTFIDSIKEIEYLKNGNINQEIKMNSILISIHRVENIKNRQRMKQLFRLIQILSKENDITILMDSVTKLQMTKYRLIEQIDQISRCTIIDKMEHDRFIIKVLQTQIIITDSGGLQEECAILNKPCLVYRLKTERNDGIGYNAFLVKDFELDSQLEMIKKLKNKKVSFLPDKSSLPFPSLEIFEIVKKVMD
jgi:UDP-N-acetylglucosamine 2-epimerase (non-hydrolysing)